VAFDANVVLGEDFNHVEPTTEPWIKNAGLLFHRVETKSITRVFSAY